MARVDYDKCGRTYSRFRRADPRIARAIHAALGDARTVLNVGAGTGSYEPTDRWVLAVEPSATMRAQRPPGAAPATQARAEALPFDDDSVDAAMACVTIHHWEPPAAGLAEMRRVARGPVVVFTFELGCLPAWQRDYLAAGLEIERPRFPSIDAPPLPSAAGCESSAYRRRPTARMGSSRPTGGARRPCSIPPCARRNRCGRYSRAGWSRRSSSAWRRTSLRDRGTPNTATFARSIPMTGRSGS